MKRFTFLLTILILTSCSTAKSQDVNPEVEAFINSQNFNIVKPEKWRAFKDHGHVSYTPLHKNDNPFENSVSVFQYRLKEETTFKDLIETRINETTNSRNIVSQKSYSEQNRLGTVYIHELETLFQGEVHKEFSMYFEHDGNYYSYIYSSLKHLYNKHADDALAIRESIEFK